MRSTICAVLALAALSGPVPAAAAETTDTTAQKVEKDKVVCRREADTGSLVRKSRVCRTVKQWEALREVNRAALTDGQNSGSSSGQ